MTTKLALPRLPIQHVPRPHLVALLERSVAGPLTLVSAPAGSGKTTLLIEWARATSLPVAWLALETADSDPLRFLAYLIASVQTLDGRIGRQAGERLDGRSTPDLEDVLSSLINDLAQHLAADAALVLDDYHVLDSEAAHAAFLFLLEHLPERLHLVLGTRSDPRLPLARLRARGQLSEIHAGALRFAATELKTFLHGMDLHLAEVELKNLEERTAGWVAGVQLAALALRGRDDPGAFLSEFHGSHRFLQEYVQEEILARQTPAVRAFLLQTSVLERLNASLCDTVTAHGGSQAMLETLHKANLFVSALDAAGEWYQYHALFAEALRHQLLQQAPDLFSQVCARASTWFEAHGMPFEACEYAVQAGDVVRAAPLVERLVNQLVGRAQFALLRRWLDQLPAETVASRPLLSVAAAWIASVDVEQREHLPQMLSHLQEDFQGRTQEAERTGWAEARVHLNLILFVQALDNMDVEQALDLAQQTLQTLPDGMTDLRHVAVSCMNLAQGLAHRLSGDLSAAERIFADFGLRPKLADYHFLNWLAVGCLIEIYEAQGELGKLARLYQQHVAMLHTARDAVPEQVVWIYTGYAKLLLEWNRLDEADEHIQQALAAGRKTSTQELTLESRVIQLDISQALGKIANVPTLLHGLEKGLFNLPPAHPMTRLATTVRARLLLGEDKVDEALRWLGERGVRYVDAVNELKTGVALLAPTGDARFAEYTLLARALIAQGRQFSKAEPLTQALAVLERLGALHAKVGFTGRVIEALALTSLALQAQGDTRAALTTLGQAISLAEPAGYVRLFANEGSSMAQLLAQVARHTTASPDYLQQLLTAFPVTPQVLANLKQDKPYQPLVDPLSAREQEVLSLMAQGASNQQIADRLVISLNTAKRHVKHILAKLDATNRTQAVARAREIRLI